MSRYCLTHAMPAKDQGLTAVRNWQSFSLRSGSAGRQSLCMVQEQMPMMCAKPRDHSFLLLVLTAGACSPQDPPAKASQLLPLYGPLRFWVDGAVSSEHVTPDPGFPVRVSVISSFLCHPSRLRFQPHG